MHAPRAKTDALITEVDGDGLVVSSAGSEVAARLDAFTAAVWRLADGCRSVGQLHAELETTLGEPVPVAQVWAALDQLADHGLLVARLVPPAGDAATLDPVGPRINRRSMLTKLGLAGGIAAAFTASGSAAARAAAGQTSNAGGLPTVRAEEQAGKELNAKLSARYDALLTQESDNKSTITTLQGSEASAKSGEASAKSGEAGAKTGETDCKTDVAAEQQTKQNAEQQNAEQQTKQNAEQQTKQNAEQQTKQNAEQQTKQNAEQQTKQNAEQQTKAP